MTAPSLANVGDREFGKAPAFSKGRDMSEYQRVPSTYLSPIERPRCPQCAQSRMLLSKVEQGPSGVDRRTFECQKCGHVNAMIISSDPMDSSVGGWLTGEMSPPR
jgi:hypothetical protein